MINRVLFDNIVKKYKLDFVNNAEQSFTNVGRILYTMSEKEFIDLQKEKKKQTTHAICEDCGQEMDGSDCTLSQIKINGKWYDRFKYGFNKSDYRKCHDCGRVKGYHHSRCDVERCPRCKGQLLSCDCNITLLRSKK